MDIDDIANRSRAGQSIPIDKTHTIKFSPANDVVFDKGAPLPPHPNGVIFELFDEAGERILSETCFSIGGGLINTLSEINQLVAPLKMESSDTCPYPFDSALSMLQMSIASDHSIPQMKLLNELVHLSEEALNNGVDSIWQAMQECVTQGLIAEGTLPGGLNLPRRAKEPHQQLQNNPADATLYDWLCAYAMAVNEENAAGHMVVTAPPMAPPG